MGFRVWFTGGADQPHLKIFFPAAPASGNGMRREAGQGFQKASDFMKALAIG